jgi:hypothetical protein
MIIMDAVEHTASGPSWSRRRWWRAGAAATAVAAKGGVAELVRTSVAQGMRTLRQDGIEKNPAGPDQLGAGEGDLKREVCLHCRPQFRHSREGGNPMLPAQSWTSSVAGGATHWGFALQLRA